MSRTLYDRDGVSVGVFAGPESEAIDGDRRRVQVEMHGRHLDLPYAAALAMFRGIHEALEGAPHSRACPVCGRPVRIYAPAGGDGSAEVFIRHKREGKRCDGSGMPADGPDAVMSL